MYIYTDLQIQKLNKYILKIFLLGEWTKKAMVHLWLILHLAFAWSGFALPWKHTQQDHDLTRKMDKESSEERQTF